MSAFGPFGLPTIDPTQFHAHLDVCARCANQPFNLCPTGARLLRDAVGADPAPVAPPPETERHNG